MPKPNVLMSVLLGLGRVNRAGFLGLTLGSEVIMIDELEAIDLSQVVHLLEASRKRAHILESLLHELQAEEAQYGLMELPD